MTRRWPFPLRRPRTCPGCSVEIPRAVNVCDPCVERLPHRLKSQFYTARARRKVEPEGYRKVLARVRQWLAMDPVKPGEVTR